MAIRHSVSAIRLSTAALGAAALTLAAARASAQPPGLTPSTGHLPSHHAVPPVPEFFASPMPTLPPPSRAEPADSTIGFRVHMPGFTAKVKPDGSLHFDDRHVGFAWLGADSQGGIGFAIQFDVTDMVMRAYGQDPYLPQKLRIMDETREERWAMRRDHDQVVMRRALDDLPRYLDAVWNQRRWSPEARRQLLFALWDEAAEDGNQFLRESGAEARRLIEEFIAHRLPPGSRYAFRAGELARLNRGRQSRQRFSPYLARQPGGRENQPSEETDDEVPPLLGVPRTLVAALRAF